ncbi:hypothetical protein [Novosphingobium sp. JCM 18896]|uniref:hypothetical protein n=1 Tax=Novosphingobium sp. JCM 18896 TaxID=2989731 RepID=UPI0022224108|nr:hypothetical protein [Novosphingobium sp. JCM 18896]MCW1432413.1 hypothetical protein [Novosphingobium sp. JCM 18896]
MDIGLCKLNALSLAEIKAKITELSNTIDQMITLNDHAVASAVFRSSAQIEPLSSGAKRIPVAREVRRLLQISGENGTTVEEIVHILSKKQPIVAQTVRGALHRSRASGTAKSVRRRWYAVAPS